MLRRIPGFLSSGVRRLQSSSSLAMADLSDSTTTPRHSSLTVEETATSSNATPNGEHGAGVVQQPARRKIASLEVIYRHLGFRNGSRLASATGNEVKTKLPRIDSIHKDSHSKLPDPTPAKDSDPQKESLAPLTSSTCSLIANTQTGGSSETVQLKEENLGQDYDSSHVLKGYSLPTSFGKHNIHPPRKSTSTQNVLKPGGGGRIKGLKNNKKGMAIESFDICLSKSEEFLVRQSDTEDQMFLSSSLDMEAKSLPEVDRLSEEPKQRVLRRGMVLLKNYITHAEQVSIVKKCRELGLGPGGFYRPGYNDGAKLQLHMMCLGQDWDPQTRKYGMRRHVDGAKPPAIPDGFQKLVDRAMQDSYALIRREFNIRDAQDMLPSISSDICIVNFYTENGRLGLHQDRDESAESLSKGLPVVSFSVGDEAEFLYGDQRDINQAEQVVLGSGDVLIFGGDSRHIFHGVSSIIPNSAPRTLLEETGLRPGRLNLTFRQF